MNKIYQKLDEIKLLWKQLKHYDTKKNTLSTLENNEIQETEEEILSGPDAINKLKNITQQLDEIIENENKFKEKLMNQIKGIVSSINYFCDILSLDDANYKDIDNIDKFESLIEKKKRLQNLELELNHMVSERKSLIKKLKKELNGIYVELGELSKVDENPKFNDLSFEYINSIKKEIKQMKIQQMKNINDFIFKTEEYYLLKEKLKYSTFFQENMDSLKYKHIDEALTLEDIPLLLKTFFKYIDVLKLKQNITYVNKIIENLDLKDIIDNIIEYSFNQNNVENENNEIETKKKAITNKVDANDNDEIKENNNETPLIKNNDDTIPINIPNFILSSVINNLKNFKEKLPKSIKLTTEFIEFLNDIINLMKDKLEQYQKQIYILLKNIRLLYEDLKIEKSKQLKLEIDKLEYLPIYEEELKNLSQMWQDTQKERVDNLMSKCCQSQEEIDEINSNLTNLYLPSSLEFINNEIERLKLHYEKYKVIYELIDERYILIDKMIKFEETASDPMRLKGSSFRLIEEEKFRKNSFPNLVRLENKLKDYLIDEEYSDFCYEGQLYLDILENEIENRVFNEAMFHINNQITYRPKRRSVHIDKKRIKFDNKSSNTDQINNDTSKKTIKFKANTLSPSNIQNIDPSVTITSPSDKLKSNKNNKLKRKISLSSSVIMKKRKSTVGLKTNRKSLPTSLEVIKK
ncbi:hypothetical protein BCR32DRAFT_244537 [Anaeromyces robustus]|uniref:Microtubule associated protein n=1 Tax=Anaeromyces robustus TaxID=1754192 RepID=A0A1Y1X883_9FUNG|nr:hypothetical protein BCR32DRAFT_244537 [Anaeromyces robustus]|eukprot:ORX81918.1 hypothetical protein BCR32DRAFT_244537 [Anaeromyces robustus]